jgi:hypothetical protein
MRHITSILTVICVSCFMASCQVLPRQAEVQSQSLDKPPADLLTQVHRDLAIIRGVKELWANSLVYSGPGEPQGPGHSHDETPTEADLARYFRDKKMPSPPVGRYVIHRIDQAPEFLVTVEELDNFLKSQKEVEQPDLEPTSKSAPVGTSSEASHP